ncbi:YqcI/YcgG family protein [Falsibacillus pallidus]|uniref:YqcI/YcgG family protein n=1 Tax=Falsibacillus pallidus TaxID=493781 RepID=A0A370GDY6_9BACI|nr:YqcI/YcgG family protein [Falsibacillus pallidus]RDI41897.1 hypothetical protein DFR59_10656 [Falsibacillus pallidus]
MAEIYSKEMIENNQMVLEDWAREAFQSFQNMIADDENTYPCVPGRIGFLSNHLRYAFLGDPREEKTLLDAADVLKRYSQMSRETGKYASLLLFYKSPAELQRYSIEEFEDLFWSTLTSLSMKDQMPWPEGISKDPTHHTWEFCFHGEPYFSFCATPAHHLRRSRHFSSFLMAFQPRWVFEQMNDSTQLGRNMKKMIRKRLASYDEAPTHPALKWYGQEDNHEWMQYFLREDESSPSKCPFHNMMNANKKS